MIGSEIRDTVMIAVACMLLASLLGFVSYLMLLRSDFASVRNDEIYASQSMASYRKYNNYNGTINFGEDVVVAIRDHYDSGLRIRVNKSDGTYYYVDKYVVREDPSLVEVENLQSWFPTTRKYKSVLVYGQVDLDTVTVNSTYTDVNSDVNAIVFFDQGTR